MELQLEDNADSSAAINAIRKKQQLLKRVVIITLAIERMQDSLKSVLILGQPSTSIPEGMLKYFQILSDKIKRKPTDQIHRYLNRLEVIIKTDLQAIINITMLDHDTYSSEQTPNEIEKPFSDKAMHLLREFNRQAQTAVSLKVLLLQRGVHTPGTVIKVPVHLIKGQLKHLAKKEDIQRNKIKAHITDMHNDLKDMLGSSEHTDKMKDVFRNVMVGLENDQHAISQGIRIDQLPFHFEVVETSSNRQQITQTSKKRDEINSGDLSEEVAEPQNASAYPGKEGFFRILFKWLNTPWSVTWDAVKKQKK